MNEHQIITLTKNIISQIRLNKIILKTNSKTHEKTIVKIIRRSKTKINYKGPNTNFKKGPIFNEN